MLVIGLTGGIGTGKSTVALIFKQLGAEIVDSDEIARTIVCPGKKAWHNIVDYFGKEILLENQEINRKKLASIVFSDKTKLNVLNKITHPEIIAAVKEKIEQLKGSSGNHKNLICIIEAPLLFETNLQEMMDKIIVVYLNREEQIKRLLTRNKLSEEEAVKRINSQIPVEEKIQWADYVINNCSSIGNTEKQIKKIWDELKLSLSKDC